MDPVMSFDPVRILTRLHADGVDFVLIGGIAARVHGSPTLTNDLDICYRRTRENCTRLAATLQALDARLRDLPDKLAAPVDVSTLWQGQNFTFVTAAGFFDCLASPEEGAATSYTELAQHAETIAIAGAPILVCSLNDLIRMKQAAGRAKDLIEIEVLKAVREARG
ncbi:MAG TPA: hypothetical protein VM733_03800 [Thermoanaerobaculia bacterium]|nr:hypothetical protein [Thermoanaerobaculia bacterium]